jgi:hypothetical protein
VCVVDATASSRSFRKLDIVPNISPACNASSNALSNNTVITTAQNLINNTGCTHFQDNPLTSSLCTVTNQTVLGMQVPSTVVCTCLAVFTNDAYFIANVSAAGGQVSGLNLTLSISVSLFVAGTNTVPLTITYVQTGVGGTENAIGGACTKADITQLVTSAAQLGLTDLGNSVSFLTNATLISSLASVSAFGVTGTASATAPSVSSSSSSSAGPAATSSSSSASSTASATPSSTGNTAASTVQVGAWAVAALIVAVFAL